ncbi:5643_t:CDS:2 [Entrophospora sp. SA101]|nr:5643_t:CDS:2 [Entrophospora sp. SA101]
MTGSTLSEKCRFPHTSGLWCLLCHKAETNFETLRAGNPSYFFIYKEDKKQSGEEQVENEFALNKVAEKIKLNESGEYEIRKKAYGEWEISEVFEKLLHKSGSSVGDINQFDIEKFTQPDPEISDDIVNSFIGELKRKKKTFIHINRNESTCREFISAFMTAAVEHVQLKESKLCLKSKEWLDGSHGFGPVEYSDFEKGAVQNIVQMHSAVEKN